MKYHQKQKWKQRIAAIIALLIAIIMVLGMILPVFAAQTPLTVNAVSTVNTTEETEEETKIELQKEIGGERFEMDVVAGFDGAYIVERMTPVVANVTNLGQGFHGEMQAKVYVSDEMDTLEYAVYSHKLDLEQGNTKKISMNLPINTIIKALEITLVDEKGTVIYRKNVPMQAKREDTMMVGVLSEQPQTMQYWSGFQAENIDKKSSFTCFLDEHTFPVSEEVMRNFRAIVIDDFDTKRLSDDQRKALQNWVSSGGLLLLGTGPQANKVLSGLDFVEVMVDGGGSVNTFSDVSGNGIALSTTMQTANIKGEKLQSTQNPLLSKCNYGSGAVLIHHFALGLAPFADLQNNTTLLASWYEKIMPMHLVENINRHMNFGYIATQLPPFSSTIVYLIFGGIVVYILLVGPVVYRFLKKKDKRERGWVVIPAVSVVFLGIMFLVAKSSPYQGNMFHSVAMVEMKENAPTAEASVYMSMKSPKKDALHFQTEENIPIQPSNTRHYYANAQNKETCQYKVLYDQEKTDVTFYDSGTWETHTVTANTALNLGGNVDCDITFDEKSVTGSVTNHTNVHFVDAVLGVGNFFVKVGEIPAGEIIQINQKINPAQLNGTNYYTQIAMALYQNEYGEDTNLMSLVHQRKISMQEGFRLKREQDLIEEVRNMVAEQSNIRGWNNKQEVCKFYGFSEMPVFGGNKYINGKPVAESSINVYHTTVTRDLSKVKEFDLPFTVVPSEKDFKSEDVILDYDRWGQFYNLVNTTDTEAEVILPYNFGKDVRIDTIEFYLDEMYENGVTKQAEIYNNKTQQWEALKDTPYTPATDYLSTDGQIQIKVFVEGQGYLPTPKLRVKGGGLYA